MWLNLTTAFAGSGAPITGTLGIAAQIATLAGALGTVLIILAWTGGLLSYAVAVCWGLVGAIIGTLDAGQPALTIAVVIGLIAVVVGHRGHPAAESLELRRAPGLSQPHPLRTPACACPAIPEESLVHPMGGQNQPPEIGAHR